MSLQDSIGQTRQMEQICITHNPNYIIPNLDFGCLPSGIDIRLVLKTGVCPAIHGGMFNYEGGLSALAWPVCPWSASRRP